MIPMLPNLQAARPITIMFAPIQISFGISKLTPFYSKGKKAVFTLKMAVKGDMANWTVNMIVQIDRLDPVIQKINRNIGSWPKGDLANSHAFYHRQKLLCAWFPETYLFKNFCLCGARALARSDDDIKDFLLVADWILKTLLSSTIVFQIQCPLSCHCNLFHTLYFN